MKLIQFALLFFACSFAGYAANVQVRNLTTTTVLPASDDYLLVDGTTNGTTKSLAMNRVYQTATRTTLAGLSVTSVASGVMVQTQGGSAVADGGSTLYYYNSTSVATPDGVNVIQPTVGSGRWLILKSAVLTPPSLSALGGVYSKAAVGHQFLSSINTDGTIGQVQPAASDISGLGSMSLQNSGSVAITGGTISSSSIDGSAIGSTTPASGAFTTLSATTPVAVTSGGTGASTASGARTNLGLGTIATQNASAVAVTGGTISSTSIDGSAIGSTTPTTGNFTVALAKGSGAAPFLGVQNTGGPIAYFGSFFDSGSMGIGTYTNNDFKFYRNNTLAGTFASTGFSAVTNISAPTLTSTVATGTAPLTVTSTTLVSNLNAQYLNGQPGSYYAAASSLGSYLPLTGGTLSGALSGTSGAFSGALSGASASITGTVTANSVSIPNVVNVRSYGATGNGSTDDSAAIASAVAALTANSALYFPSGVYLCNPSTAGLTGFSTNTHITVFGDGMYSTTIKSSTGSQVLNFAPGCSYITVRDLTLDGNCTARTAGQQALNLDASHSLLSHVRVVNSGEFAISIGQNSSHALVNDVQVIGCVVNSSFADGINLGYVSNAVVANNLVDGADDDCIAVGHNYLGAQYYATNVNVVGNICRARTDLATTWGRGIIVMSAQNVLVASNLIENIKQDGILVFTDNATYRPTNVSIVSNTTKNVSIDSGYSITLYFTTNCSCKFNTVIDPASGNGIEICDWQNLAVEHNSITCTLNQFFRGIHATESATIMGLAVTSPFNNLRLAKNDITLSNSGGSTTSNDCIRINPGGAGVWLQDNTVIDDNDCYQASSPGQYIEVDYCDVATKIVNNTCIQSKTVATGSNNVVAPITANNN